MTAVIDEEYNQDKYGGKKNKRGMWLNQRVFNAEERE